jgi:hypothetical protein
MRAFRDGFPKGRAELEWNYEISLRNRAVKSTRVRKCMTIKARYWGEHVANKMLKVLGGSRPQD